MGPIDATFRCIGRPLSWRGRASPSEYWGFTLIHATLWMAVVAGSLWPAASLALAEARVAVPPAAVEAAFLSGMTSIGWAMALCLWPNLCHLSVTVRRLHDTDRSGWWCWIALVPVVGPLVLLRLLTRPGDPDRNAYGRAPAPVMPPEGSGAPARIGPRG